MGPVLLPSEQCSHTDLPVSRVSLQAGEMAQWTKNSWPACLSSGLYWHALYARGCVNGCTYA